MSDTTILPVPETELPLLECPQPIEIQKSWFDQHRTNNIVSDKKDGSTYSYDIFLESRAIDSNINWFGLLANIPGFWEQLSAHHPGKTVPVPRLSAFCSRTNYNQEVEINTVIYNAVQPPSIIGELWLKICQRLGWQREFGQAIALKFADGTQSVGYNNWVGDSDDLQAMTYLWLGAARPVLYRNSDKKITKRLTMVDCSLFVVPRENWFDWQFQVPKTKSRVGESILLIFR